MNYYGAKELADSFRTVRKNTIVIAQELPEDKYAFRPAPGNRTPGELLTHIALAYSFAYQINAVERRTAMEGFDFLSLMQGLAVEEKSPRTKDQTVDLLSTHGEKWASFVEGVPENFLAEVITMPPGGTPESRTRFDMILSVKEHEMHHRGQLMLIERMIGITPHLTRAMEARRAAMAQKS